MAASSCLVLFITNSTSLKRCPFMSLFIRGNKKKVTRSKVGWVGSVGQRIHATFNQKLANWYGCMSRCIVVMEKPFPCLPQIGPDNSAITSMVRPPSSSTNFHKLHELSQHFCPFWKLKDVQNEVCHWSSFHLFLNRKTTRTFEFFPYRHFCKLFATSKLFLQHFSQAESKICQQHALKSNITKNEEQVKILLQKNAVWPTFPGNSTGCTEVRMSCMTCIYQRGMHTIQNRPQCCHPG